MRAAVLVLCLLAGGAGLVAQAGATDPLEFYKGYLAVLAKAKTLDEYQLTAKTAAGAVTTGGATLVKEGGAWKVEDEAWASPVP